MWLECKGDYMAVKKKIKQPNGIEMEYHRIAMIKIDMNQQITVLVESYLNEESRQYEKAYAEGNIAGEPIFPYTTNEYINFGYDKEPEMFDGDITKNVYKWLKKQNKFEGAEDV